ncbi:CoA pyrophosphatase [Parathalassolituus penaei]|uniref:CoA pyrophosphatase n=1 Tax=Parathalassolituus penaei TaxID=2997323 RepID=A0A9X3EM04_9GAMM|nr:CoA pyrophosphatase [Parathalassolituus penaei]MCY0966826.1 CoA pyrophosphatase [Parathalassolituus penaei]
MNQSDLFSYLSGRWQDHDPKVMHQPDLKEAAVLVAITDCAEEPMLLLTRRSSHMPTHKGEVAFPGGKRDAGDVDFIATALREAEEEVGLDPSLVRVVGELDQIVSIHGFLVTPVLAVIPHDVRLVADPGELECLFMAPLALFRRPPDSYFRREGYCMPNYQYGDFRIWGLTACVIAELMNRYWDMNIKVGRPM